MSEPSSSPHVQAIVRSLVARLVIHWAEERRAIERQRQKSAAFSAGVTALREMQALGDVPIILPKRVA